MQSALHTYPCTLVSSQASEDVGLPVAAAAVVGWGSAVREATPAPEGRVLPKAGGKVEICDLSIPLPLSPYLNPHQVHSLT